MLDPVLADILRPVGGEPSRSAEDILLAPAATRSAEDILLAAPARPSFLGEMGQEAKRLLMLPGRTFMEGMNRGSEQWQKAAEGEPIDVGGYKLPAVVSAPLRKAYGLLEGVNAPFTAATRVVTDPASRLLQSATGMSEPTREMVQGMGDVVGGVFGPTGIAKLLVVPGAFKAPPPLRRPLRRAVEEPSVAPLAPAEEVLGLVPAGHVRVFRGEPSTPARGTVGTPEALRGQWFSEDRAIAEMYAKDLTDPGAKSRLVYLDVPEEVANAARVDKNPEALAASMRGTDTNWLGKLTAEDPAEFVFPPEWSSKARDLTPSAQRFDRGAVAPATTPAFRAAEEVLGLEAPVVAAQRFERTAMGDQALMEGLPQRAMPTTASRARVPEADIQDTALFGQERAASEAAMARSQGVIWDAPAVKMADVSERALQPTAPRAAPFQAKGDWASGVPDLANPDDVAGLFGPEMAGAMRAAIEQGGRVNPQLLSSLAGSATGGLGGVAAGDTLSERINLGLVGATLGGFAGRQAGKLLTRPGVASPPAVAPVAAPVPPVPRPRPFGELENVLGMPLTETRMATPLTGAIANAADAAVIPRIAAGPNQRLFRHVQDALTSGEIAPETLPRLLERHGVTATEFARDYAQAVSDSGRTLAQLSHLRRRIESVLSTEPEAAKILAGLPPAQVGTFAKVMNVYRHVDDQRRALLVSQWATTARNVESQAARMGLDSLDNAFATALGGGSTIDSLRAGLDNVAAVARSLSPAGRKRLADIMDAFPLDAERLAGTISGEAALGSKLSNFVNPLNRAQEGFTRKVAFDSMLSTLARERGLDLDRMTPAQIPSDMIEQAAKHALEITFAATPQPGSFGAAMMNAYRELPILTTINPFPRYMTNALRFLYEFSPLGITKLLTPEAQRTLASGNPAAKARVISRATLGTGMLAAAVAIRASDVGGEKWYELNVGGDQRLNALAMGPFNIYLLAAEAIVHPERLQVADIAKGALGINRIAGTGLVLVDLFENGTLDRKLDMLKTFAGAYLGGFSVPARNFKAMIEGAGSPDVAARESLYRDARESPLTGPFLTNLPGVSQSFPAMVSSTSSVPMRNENPFLRQLSGLSVSTKNEARQMLDTLGLANSQVQPTSGIPAWDRAVAAPLGPVVEQIMPLIGQAPGYRDLPREIQRYLVRQALTESRKAATDAATATHPALAGQAALKGLDPDLRDLVGITRKGERRSPNPVPDFLQRVMDAAGVR